jgi:nucleoside-diphosphate-sugar epimerase
LDFLPGASKAVASASIKKRVLLTGATGFVGRQIHKALVAGGHEVRPVIRAGTQSRLLAGDPCVSANLFAESRPWWAEICKGCNTIIHAAWFVEPSTYLTSRSNVDCLSGSLRLALGALDAHVSDFIGIGTCFEYRLPASDITIASPLGPTTLYAATKLALFQALGGLFAETATRFAWARLFYLYGEGENEKRLVPYLRARLARNEPAELSIGTQIRDFLDVRVAGELIASLVSNGQSGPVNICSGVPVTIRQLAERIADETGQRGLLKFGTAPPKATDPSVATGVCNLVALPQIGRAA